MEKAYKNLFKPIQIGGVTIKNRYAMGPMGTAGLLIGQRGEFTPAGIDYFCERARGGFGLICMGTVTTDMEVDRPNPIEGKPSPLYAPRTFKESALTLTERMHTYGAKVFIQLTLGHGRIRKGERTPSEVPSYYDPSVITSALTAEQIESKIASAVKTASFIQSCGFDGIEVHAMHWGYLLDQFAMSIFNSRTDEYGGTLEKRLTVARKVVEGMKAVCGENYPVAMRLGLKSYMKGFNEASLHGEEEVGRTLEEGIRIARLLESYGYDMLSVDSGIYDSFYYCAPPAYMPSGYNLKLAREAKKAVRIPIFTAGRMDDPDMCDKAIAQGETDGVVLARASLAEPHYAKKVMMGRTEKIRPCINCQNCTQNVLTLGVPSCAVNPVAMREFVYGFEKAVTPKKVVVIGGGLAGMEAARMAKLRGHDVQLYEKTDRLGGHLSEAGVHVFKDGIRKLNEWYQHELEDLKVPVKLNTAATSDMIKSLGVDAAIFATGSTPIVPRIEGIDSPKTVACTDALLGQKEVGNRIVVVGGGLVGAEMAYEYALDGKDVTLVEALDDILASGPSIPYMCADMLKDLLKEYKVNIMTTNRIEAITDKGALISNKDGVKTELEADHVVIAIGYRPSASMLDDFLGEGIDVYQIGDGRMVGNVRTAILDAYEVTRKL